MLSQQIVRAEDASDPDQKQKGNSRFMGIKTLKATAFPPCLTRGARGFSPGH
jgi:hypothetical protein